MTKRSDMLTSFMAPRPEGTSIPYISHLMIVSALVIENGGSEDQAIGGLLHDAAEDQGGAETLEEIRTRFGDPVAEIVSDCTDSWDEPKPDWRPRKEAYLAKLPAKPRRSLLVSLADKTHNAEAILFDYRASGDPLWDRFNGGAEGTHRLRYRVDGKRFTKTFHGSLTEARKEVRRLLQSGDTGEHVEPAKVTVAAWIDRWIALNQRHDVEADG